MPDGRVMLFLGKARSLIVLPQTPLLLPSRGAVAFMVQRVATVAFGAVDVQVQVASGPPLSMTKHGSLRGTSDAPVSSQRRY
jgi:hypothetical protein